MANRVGKRNNVLKAFAGANCGQQKETTDAILSIMKIDYAAPVWSESNIGKIQLAKNEAVRIITGSHKMSSIDHLHSETDML